MQPLHCKPKHRCVAAARDHLSQALSWLRGYPIAPTLPSASPPQRQKLAPKSKAQPARILLWQPAPPRHRRVNGFPKPLPLDSQLLRKSYRALLSLPKLFPEALPLALQGWGSIEAWQQSLGLRLELISQLVHKHSALPTGRELWSALGLDPAHHRRILQLYGLELGARLSLALAWRLADSAPPERLDLGLVLARSFEEAARLVLLQFSAERDLVPTLLRLFDLIAEAPQAASLWFESLTHKALWDNRAGPHIAQSLEALRQALAARPLGKIPALPDFCQNTRMGPRLCKLTLDLEACPKRELPTRLRLLNALLPWDELLKRYQFSQRFRQVYDDLAFDRRRHGSLAHHANSLERIDALQADWKDLKAAYFPSHFEQGALSNAARSPLPIELLEKLAELAPEPRGPKQESQGRALRLTRLDLRSLCMTMADPCPSTRATFRRLLPQLSLPLLGLLHEVLDLGVDDLICAIETTAEQPECGISSALSLLPKLRSALCYARRQRLANTEAQQPPPTKLSQSNSLELLFAALASGAEPEKAWDYTRSVIAEINTAISFCNYPRLIALSQLDPKIAGAIAASKLKLQQLPQAPILSQWLRQPGLRDWLRSILTLAHPESIARAIPALAKLSDDPPAFPEPAPLDSAFPEALQFLVSQVLGFSPSRRPRLLRKLNLQIFDKAATKREIKALEERLLLEPDHPQRRHRLSKLRARLDLSPPEISPRRLQRWRSWLQTQLARAIADQLETIARAQLEAETRLLLSLPKGAQLCAALEEAPKHLNRHLKTLLARRLGPPPWDLRDQSDNARALKSLESKGMDLQRWLEPQEPIQRTIKNQIWTFAIEHDPLLTLQMGEIFDTCLSFDGCNFQSTIVNVIDINKQVIYGRVDGQIRARLLVGLSQDACLIPFRLYAHEACDELYQAVREVLAELATGLKVSLRGPWGDQDRHHGVPPILAQDHYIDPCGSPLLSPQMRLEQSGHPLSSLAELADDRLLAVLQSTFGEDLEAPGFLSQVLALSPLQRPSLRLQLLYKIPEALRSPQNALEIAEAELKNDQPSRALQAARQLLSLFPNSGDLSDDFWARSALVSQSLQLSSHLRKFALRALQRKNHSRSGPLTALAICARALHRHKRAQQFAREALADFVHPTIRPILQSIAKTQKSQAAGLRG